MVDIEGVGLEIVAAKDGCHTECLTMRQVDLLRYHVAMCLRVELRRRYGFEEGSLW